MYGPSVFYIRDKKKSLVVVLCEMMISLGRLTYHPNAKTENICVQLEENIEQNTIKTNASFICYYSHIIIHCKYLTGKLATFVLESESSVTLYVPSGFSNRVKN